MKTREQVFEVFKDVTRKVWRNPDFVLPAVVLSQEEPGGRVLASLAWQRDQRVWASGNSILQRPSQYTLRIAQRLLEADEATVRSIMIHESVHLGYPKHDATFRTMCRDAGGAVSEEALDGKGIEAQKKVGSRYQTVKTFIGNQEKEAAAWVREQLRAEPGSKWRLSLGETP